MSDNRRRNTLILWWSISLTQEACRKSHRKSNLDPAVWPNLAKQDLLRETCKKHRQHKAVLITWLKLIPLCLSKCAQNELTKDHASCSHMLWFCRENYPKQSGTHPTIVCLWVFQAAVNKTWLKHGKMCVKHWLLWNAPIIARSNSRVLDPGGSRNKTRSREK